MSGGILVTEQTVISEVVDTDVIGQEGKVGLPDKEVMEANTGAAKRMAMMTCPSLKKFRGVFLWWRGIGVAARGETGTGVNGGEEISSGVVLIAALGLTFPLIWFSQVEVQMSVDVIEGDDAVEEQDSSPVRELVEGEEGEWHFENHRIDEISYMEGSEWKKRSKVWEDPNSKEVEKQLRWKHPDCSEVEVAIVATSGLGSKMGDKNVVQLVLELQSWMTDWRMPIIVKIWMGKCVFEVWTYMPHWIHLKEMRYEEPEHLTTQMSFCQKMQQTMDWGDGVIREGGAWDTLGTEA
ncbi:hypothetical protein HD554DRAFT_2038184 [Boletus coccyginus]|nr:hypothetical protein HD554DRAFT_2038184 [Boletus coccyginus]